MEKLTYLGISGSLRRASRNTGLLRCCAAHLPEGVALEIVDISGLPFYNADIEKPAAVAALADKVRACDALVLACPEYNHSLAPALKNALDWLSRENPSPLAGKPGCIVGAAAGMGSVRSQNHLRQVCSSLDMYLLNKPEFFSNAFSADFDVNGDLVGAKQVGKIADLMAALTAWTRKLRAAG